MDDDFNNQNMYDNYGESINKDIGESLAKAAHNSAAVMRDLKDDRLDRAMQGTKNLNERDSDKELGEDNSSQKGDELGEETSKEKNDELGEGNQDGDELGEESESEKEDELGEDEDDEDGDGTPDSEEDSDGDGTPDSEDEDSDDLLDKDGDDDSPLNGDGKGKLGSKISALKRKFRLLKIKIILIAIGCCLAILLIGGLAGAFLQPFAAITQTVAEIGEKIKTASEKIANLVTLKGYKDNEQVFWAELNSQAETFKKLNAASGAGGADLDIALLAAAIHYDTVIDDKYFEESDYDSGKTADFGGKFIIKEPDVPDFYAWAEEVLGDFKTWRIGERGLSGALVSEYYDQKCEPMSAKSILEIAISYIDSGLVNFFAGVSATLSDDLEALNLYQVVDSYFVNVERTGENPLEYLKNELSENANSLEAFGYDMRKIFSYESKDCGKQEFVVDWCFGKNCRVVTDKDGNRTYYEMQQLRPVYIKTYRNDLTKFENYLKAKDGYLERYYINCKNCAYKDYPQEKRDELKETMIEQIYDLRDFYLEALGLTSTSTCEGKYESTACASSLVPLSSPATSRCPNCQCAAGVYNRISNFLPSMDSEAWNKFLGVYGNAIDYWTNNAKLGIDGFKCSTEPKVGSAVVWSGGSKGFGHIMFIEKDNGDGTFLCWECNYDSEESCRLKNWTADEIENWNSNSYDFQGYINFLGDC